MKTAVKKPGALNEAAANVGKSKSEYCKILLLLKQRRDVHYGGHLINLDHVKKWVVLF